MSSGKLPLGGVKNVILQTPGVLSVLAPNR